MMTHNKSHRINRIKRPAITLLATLLIITIVQQIFEATTLHSAQVNPPRHYYYQPPNSIYLDLLDQNERDLTEIIRQRLQKVWGASATPYLDALTDNPYHGYYQSDSTLSQRRALWRSSLFAQDLDFFEVAISTFDGQFSFRETYAINRYNKRWAVIDSAGFPLFERIIDISEDNVDSESGRRDFLLTLLSYAGYGSFDILSKSDSVYHEIDLKETLGEDFYPFEITVNADTTETTFTCCLRDGVEVSRWRIKHFDDGLLIDESEQLVTYEDLPETEPERKASEKDTTALAGLLSDVIIDSLTGDTITDSSQSANTAQAPSGEIRLADLLRGGAKTQAATGTISFEIIEAKLLNPLDSTPINQIPEFTKFVEPVYPPQALAAKAEGDVEIMLRVDSTGKARQTMIRKRADKKLGFELSAKKAGEQSEFRPGIADGEKTDMWLTYKLKFRLSGARFQSSPAQPAAIADTTAATSDSTLSDTLNVDTTSIDSSSTDTTRLDTTKADTNRTDTAIADTNSADTSSIDTSKIDSTTNDTTKTDSTTTDTTAIDTTTVDTTVTDTTNINPVKPDTVKADTSKADTSKADTTKPDTLKADTTKLKADTSAATDSTKSK